MLWKLLCLITLLFMDVSCRSVAVKGNLKCGKYPAGQILVRLWDSSRVEGTTDKLIDQTHSDSDGNFKLTAHGSLKNGWQPILSVHHDCDDAKNKTFDLGIFNLEAHIIESEERVEQITRRRRHRFRAHRSANRHRDRTTTAQPLDQFDSPEDRIEPW